MNSLVVARRKILDAIMNHLQEEECNHSLSQILSSEIEGKEKGLLGSCSNQNPTATGNVDTYD